MEKETEWHVSRDGWSEQLSVREKNGGFIVVKETETLSGYGEGDDIVRERTGLGNSHSTREQAESFADRYVRSEKEAQRQAYDEKYPNIESHRAKLEAERNSIVATLGHIQEIPAAERPLGIENKYGRVIEIERELGVKDPYSQGYEAEKRRLTEVVPRTVEQMTAITEKEERLSGPRAHAEIVINRNGQGVTDDEFRYLRGEKAAIEHWTFEQRPRLVVATELERYAERVSQPHYVNAEEAMARNFADQLAAGRKDIDLTQHYATDAQEKASDRHVKAVENLWPLIEEARNHGYMVTTGHAITQQQKHAEVMAISEGMRV